MTLSVKEGATNKKTTTTRKRRRRRKKKHRRDHKLTNSAGRGWERLTSIINEKTSKETGDIGRRQCCWAAGNVLGVIAPISPGLTRGYCQGKFALQIYLCVFWISFIYSRILEVMWRNINGSISWKSPLLVNIISACHSKQAPKADILGLRNAFFFPLVLK